MLSSLLFLYNVLSGRCNSKVCIKNQVLVLSNAFDGEHVMNCVMSCEAQLTEEAGLDWEGCRRVSFDATFGFGCLVDLKSDLDFIVVVFPLFDVVQSFKHIVDGVSGLNLTCLDGGTSCSCVIIYFVITLCWVLLQNQLRKMIKRVTNVLTNWCSELRVLGAVQVNSSCNSGCEGQELLDPLVVRELVLAWLLLGFHNFTWLNDTVVLEENLSGLFKQKCNVLGWHYLLLKEID